MLPRLGWLHPSVRVGTATPLGWTCWTPLSFAKLPRKCGVAEAIDVNVGVGDHAMKARGNLSRDRSTEASNLDSGAAFLRL